MTLKKNLLLARSHIAFITGLLGAFSLIAYFEGWTYSDFEAHIHPPTDSEEQRIKLPIPVTSVEMRSTGKIDSELQQWAHHAWKYFENNYQSQTGLVNSANGYPSTTLWDTASYLLGLISAHRIGIVDDPLFDERIKKALDSLAKIKLVDGIAPNKAYHTETLAMVDYNNHPAPDGVGWSAIDTGRLLIPLQVLVWDYPQYTPAVRKVVSRWGFNQFIRNGILYGAERDANGRLELLQEGRLGYEEYASKSFSLLGLDVGEAILYDDHLEIVDVDGIQIAADDRDFERLGANNYVVSEPYVLDGIEFGFDQNSKALAINVYMAQRDRAKRLGIPTAVSETQLDQAPYFVYNTVFANGEAWNTITEKNEDASAFRTLSTKAALGWYALFDDPYTDSLLSEIRNLFDVETGFFSGRYETSGEINAARTANTNGIVLESIAYLYSGPLLALYRLSEPEVPDSNPLEAYRDQNNISDSAELTSELVTNEIFLNSIAAAPQPAFE